MAVVIVRVLNKSFGHADYGNGWDNLLKLIVLPTVLGSNLTVKIVTFGEWIISY